MHDEMSVNDHEATEHQSSRNGQHKLEDRTP